MSVEDEEIPGSNHTLCVLVQQLDRFFLHVRLKVVRMDTGLAGMDSLDVNLSNHVHQNMRSHPKDMPGYQSSNIHQGGYLNFVPSRMLYKVLYPMKCSF